MVPISAHALFARPMVVGARLGARRRGASPDTDGAGVLWCDGRRTVELPPGARIEVRRGDVPVRLARLHQAPFTDRLVAKFGLPVERLARCGRAPRLTDGGPDRCLRSCGSPRSASSTSRCSSWGRASPP